MGELSDISAYLLRVSELERDGDHAAACHVLREALEQLPAEERDLRGTVLVKLSLFCFKAGQVEEAVHAAEEAAETVADPSLRMNAHSSAGVALSSLNRLDASQVHRRLALKLARGLGNRGAESRALTGLAIVELRRGNLSNSIQAAEEAIAVDPATLRTARLTQGDACRIAGDFEAARRHYRAGAVAPARGSAANERRSQAILAISQAWNEAEAGDASLAKQRLQEASELDEEPKLGGTFRTTRAWVLALAGDISAARTMVSRVCRELASANGEGEAGKICESLLGRACCVLGDWEAGLRLWQAYLESDPSPAYRPLGLYFRGLCSLRLGDVESARDLFEEAVAMGLPTYHSQLAKEALTEIAR